MPRQDRSTMLRLEALEIRTNPSSTSLEGVLSPDGPTVEPEIVLVQPEDSSPQIDSSTTASDSGSKEDSVVKDDAKADDAGTTFETMVYFVSDASAPTDETTTDPSTEKTEIPSGTADTEAPTDTQSPIIMAMTLKEEGASADSTEPSDMGDDQSQTGIFTITSQPTDGTTDTSQETSSTDTTEGTVKDETDTGSEETKSEETTEDSTTQTLSGDDLNGDDVDPSIYQNSVVPNVKPMTLSLAEVQRLAAGFVSSQEFAQNMVQAAFLKYLGRLAEQQGLSAWANALMSGQIDSTQMFISIAASQENLKNAGYNAHNLFRDLYQNALGRDADEAGLEDWVKALFVATGKKLGLGNDHIMALYQADKNGLSSQAFLATPVGLQTLRESVAGLLNSAEFRRYTVRSVYGGILDRQAAEKEIQTWVQYLAAGHGQEDLIRQFVQSKEYQNHFRTPRAYITGLYGDLLFRAPDAQGFLAMTGKFGPNGQFVSTIDPELNQYYQELIVDAQSMGITTNELLQDDLDEAYSIRVEGFLPENLQFIADNNPGFALGLLGSFLRTVAPAELTAGVDLSDGYQVYAFLRDHGDQLAEELGTSAEPSSADFDVSKWMEAMPEQGGEMFAWLKSLYYQSIPERIAKYLPPADRQFDWSQFLPPGTILPGSGDTWPAGSDQGDDEDQAAA